MEVQSVSHSESAPSESDLPLVFIWERVFSSAQFLAVVDNAIIPGDYTRIVDI